MRVGRHISGQFNAELESLRTHALAMGGLVEQQLSLALQAMQKQDARLSKQIKKEDEQVNKMEQVIDEACTRVIAKRQPTAKDLRLIMAVVKTISELERIGDVAFNVSNVAEQLFSRTEETLLVTVSVQGELAISMLHQALDAFARMDVEAAVDVYHMDKKLNDTFQQTQAAIMEQMIAAPDMIPKLMSVMAASQAIAQVGDRCQKICQYILYFVEGVTPNQRDFPSSPV